MIDILINQLDEHNEGNILATTKLQPKEVYYLRLKEQENTMKNIKEYYINNFPKIILKEIIIEEGNISKLTEMIVKVKKHDIVVNLTGGKRINSLILLKVILDFNLKGVYIDILNKKVYTFNEEINMVNEELEDLKVEDIINTSGGDVIEEASCLKDKEDLLFLTKSIYKNLALWHKYKQKLHDSNIFTHDVEDTTTVIINTNSLVLEEKELLDRILKKLKDLNGISYKSISEDKYKVVFLKDYLKGFIFKSGTWLEVATNLLISEIKEIDEVKSGLIFLWSSDSKTVRNEVDVVAVKDSVPICISCKDSDKYNELALNELEVYSEKIGGEKVYKILVATKEPLKSAVRARAKEMDINIVIFDGDEEKFKRIIKEIINKFSKFEI